jgi:hypothetical protein
MEANDAVLGALGFIAAVVISLVDGRRAIMYASLASAAALAPSVAAAGGSEAILVLCAAAALATALLPFTRSMGRRLSWLAGVDPVVPVVARGEALFGPRSVRAASFVVVLPAASWVTFNVPLGAASTVSGALLPAALVYGCAAMRLLTARTLNDIAVGVAALGIAASAAWFLCAGVDTLPSAAAAASLAPAAAVAAGWLSGRHAPAAGQARGSA